MRQLVKFCCAALILAGTLAAQPTITDVVNAGSRIASGLPNYGIAQGAIFLVTGANLGPDPLQQATFPLPSGDGLAGVTVQVTVGDVTANAIMVYASPTEVAAILPSNTPTGTGTVTLNNNGDSATAPITVVAAAFGAFTQDRTGNGPALAFNVVPDDGSTVLNTLTQPAQPGQTVMLNGTGLGATTDVDETQQGSTSVPSTTVKLYVGTKEASIISAGRGTCCTGLDPNFPIPQGTAGWDVIQFTVPDGITGCHVPVAVQAGDLVSNFATIAVAVGGDACMDPGGFSGSDLQNLSGNVRIGNISLSRSSIKMTADGMSIENKTDSGSASFMQFDLAQFQAGASPFEISAIGSCIVVTSKVNADQIPSITAPFTTLDAGDAITITGKNGSKTMARDAKTGSYSASFGTSMTLPPIPGMPSGGFPGMPGAGSGYLDSGSYTANNGGGGADVKNFNATLDVPDPIKWENQDDINDITRSEGVPVKWSGGGPNALVNIMGMSSSKAGDATIVGTFICTEKSSALQFTVPPAVTLSLPASAMGADSNTPSGTLLVESSVMNPFKAEGIDLGYFSSSVASMKNLNYK